MKVSKDLARRVGQAERHNAILDRISGMGSVAVSEMAELLGVSEATIRRDLDHLATRQLVERAHGGAFAHRTAVASTGGRRQRAQAQHRSVTALLAGRCEGVPSLALTGSGLAELLAGTLTGRSLSVITNSLDVAARLAASPTVELVVTGGVRRPGLPLLVGGLAESATSGFHTDLAIVVAEGVSPRGVTVQDAEVARVASCLVAKAARVIVACPPEGIGRDRYGHICDPEAVREVVTWVPGEDGTKLDPVDVRSLEESGLVVTVVTEPKGGTHGS
jgi:DeoR family transcriptional regulator of aga operon